MNGALTVRNNQPILKWVSTMLNDQPIVNWVITMLNDRPIVNWVMTMLNNRPILNWATAKRAKAVLGFEGPVEWLCVTDPVDY